MLCVKYTLSASTLRASALVQSTGGKQWHFLVKRLSSYHSCKMDLKDSGFQGSITEMTMQQTTSLPITKVGL